MYAQTRLSVDLHALCVLCVWQVQSKRHIAQPNNGFLLELADLEVELLGFSSVASSTAKMWNFREFNKQRKRYKVAPQRPKQCIIM